MSFRWGTYSQSPWEHRGEGSGAGVVKQVSDPGPGPSPGPSRFILSLGPCGDRLGAKSPGCWWVGSAGLWALAGAASLRPGPSWGSPATSSPLALQDDPQCAHRAALRQRWLLRGSGLDFVGTHVLHRESGLPPPRLPQVGAGGEPSPSQLNCSSFFQVRSLRTAALGPDSMGAPAPRQRLQLYLTLGAAAFQPLIIYWLTFHLVR